MALFAFITCGVTAFYTQRAKHGSSSAERAGYAAGAKAGAEAPRDAQLPTAAGLHQLAQQHFKQEGSGNQGDWNLGFAHGYEAAFSKSHPR